MSFLIRTMKMTKVMLKMEGVQDVEAENVEDESSQETEENESGGDN